MKKILLALSLSLAAATALAAERVYFVEPADGAAVKSPFKVRFGVEGMAIAPAGDMKPGTGHHHLIIDGSSVPLNEVVATDDSHRHFGKGQTETELTLPPGEHTLTLQFANGAHQSFGPAMSSSIKVRVVP
nr:DUF4399 domain-containing protein [uncultured Pseudogulbenkiania sp.]